MRLRKLEPKDAQGMLSWMHNPEISSVFQCDFQNFDLDRVNGFIESAQEDSANLHRACVDDNDRYLGTVSLKNIDPVAKNAEYAISFCKEAHGTGASAFATREILNIAFNELKLERVYLNVRGDNARANSFYKKFGFIYEGSFKKHVFAGGEFKDLNWYRILREEFNKE